jgi:hypothetical protein
LAPLVTLLAALAILVTAPAEARTHRSAAAKHAFQHGQPCPATGKQRGACPGYVIDHVIPLACGGPDAPSNMQWQTIAEGKAKDRWERAQCRPLRSS